MKIFNTIMAVKKSIQKRSYNDSNIEYYVEFNIIKNHILFGTHSFASSQPVMDRIIFETKGQADDYIDNVDRPSIWKYDDGGDWGMPIIMYI